MNAKKGEFGVSHSKGRDLSLYVEKDATATGDGDVKAIETGSVEDEGDSSNEGGNKDNGNVEYGDVTGWGDYDDGDGDDNDDEIERASSNWGSVPESSEY